MLIACLATLPLALTPHPPAPPFVAQDGERGSLLIRATRLIVRPGEELENAAVLVQDGVIVALGEGLTAPAGAREIAGEVVCAALLDPWSVLGVDSTSARDESTTPASRSADVIDRYSARDHLEEALRAGVTTVRAQAGVHALFGGVGAVVRLDPDAGGSAAVVLEDACLSSAIGLPRGGRPRDIFDRVGEVSKLVGEIESGRKYREARVEYRYDLEEWEKEIAEKEKELDKGFKKAKKERDKKKKEAEEKDKEFKEKKYKEDKKPRRPKYDEDDEVMARVANGEVPLVVEVHRFEELRNLLEKTESLDRLRLVVAGGTEALGHADELAERKIPVIVWPRPMDASRPDEWIGHEISLARDLAAAGVEVLIGSGGSDTTRDLRLIVALAVSRGLDREAALRAVTLAPALAFDVGDRLGSIELGKDAEILVLDGDPLDTTSRIQYVVSHGSVVVEP